MKQTRIVIAAAAAAAGVLFAAPTITSATPLTPISSTALATAGQEANPIDQVASRHRYVKRKFVHRGWRHNRRFARCWNCGNGWYWRHHRRHGAPFYLSFGYPYGYGYPYYYPYYGYGPSIGFGFRIH
jgi:hypothetical protein